MGVTLYSYLNESIGLALAALTAWEVCSSVVFLQGSFSFQKRKDEKHLFKDCPIMDNSCIASEHYLWKFIIRIQHPRENSLAHFLHI